MLTLSRDMAPRLSQRVSGPTAVLALGPGGAVRRMRRPEDVYVSQRVTVPRANLYRSLAGGLISGPGRGRFRSGLLG